jgi:hypothetical protein
MSEVLDAGIQYVASTTRWSGHASRMYMQGTLWYGIMCRSFLLLERMLRLSLIEVARLANLEIQVASKSRASGKPLDAMTFGQCLGVLEEIAPSLSGVLVSAFPHLQIPLSLLPNDDRIGWNRVVSLRNRMTHEGPGFLDAVDLRSGRIWRRYRIVEPLEKQATEIWAIGRHLCRSPFVLTCIALQGCDESLAIAELDSAETARFSLKEVGGIAEQAIEAFHAR